MTHRILWVAALAAVLSTSALAADPGLYPGAKLDPDITEQARKASPTGAGPETITASITPDSFEKVLDFYKAAGTEVRMMSDPGQPQIVGYERALPGEIKDGKIVASDRKVKQVVVILDGAPDLRYSKHWVTLIRPFVFDVAIEGDRFVYKDVREVTVILQSKE